MSDPDCYRLPLASYPGINRFVLDWLDGKTNELLPREASDAKRSRPEPPPELVEALIESNRRWGLFVGDDVRRWARGQTVTLIAGQQVGFAGGPLYTLAKLTSLLKMKRELESQGQPATIFFWLATEDHDYPEIATVSFPIPNGQRDLIQLRATRGYDSKAVVGPERIPEVLIEELLALLSMERPSWLREGVTFRDSFAELLATLLEGHGVILIDALLPELRRAGAPLFARIAERWDDVQTTLRERSRALQVAGYAPQILAREGDAYTLFFRIDEHGSRNVLAPPFDVGQPETISTSALTRPLLQDFVIRPDVFVGGPAEVAYYAQLAPLHELLDVPQPRVALRGHALAAPSRVLRAIPRYGLDPEHLFAGTDELLAEREPDAVAEVHAIADTARRQLFAQIEKIRDLALPADHALGRSIARSIGHLDYHFDKLAERAVRGLVRKDRERLAAVRELTATLYPDRHVQDRVVGWFALWREYGRHLVDRLIDEIEPDSPRFSIIGL